MGYTPEMLQDMLDRIKHQKQLDAVNPAKTVRPYTDFQPQQLSYQVPETTDMYEKLQDAVMQGDRENTATAMIKAQNQYNYNQYQQAKNQHSLAQQNFVEPGKPGGVIPANAPNLGSDWASPPLADPPTGLDPNAPMRTMNFHGMSYTVNSTVAGRFQNFLKGLWALGYHPKSIQGYNKRNIAGTSTPSLHSYGFAIDIDPTLNPVYKDNNPKDDVYALPPSVSALAAKYGLSWGGNWHSYKDYMHFSVPYGGRE